MSKGQRKAARLLTKIVKNNSAYFTFTSNKHELYSLYGLFYCRQPESKTSSFINKYLFLLLFIDTWRGF
jgi:hypothetical protein